MAAKKKPSTPRSPLIGNQAKPTVLDDTTKLDIDTKKTLVDNIIDYDDIDYPDESERGTVFYERKSLEAEHKWEVEEEKVVEAMTQYLQDTIGEYSNNRVHIEFKG